MGILHNRISARQGRTLGFIWGSHIVTVTERDAHWQTAHLGLDFWVRTNKKIVPRVATVGLNVPLSSQAFCTCPASAVKFPHHQSAGVSQGGLPNGDCFHEGTLNCSSLSLPELETNFGTKVQIS